MSGADKNDNVALEERIERIRKNNEKIQRRHLEVEADKQKAAKLNALVQLKQLPDEEEEPFQHPYSAKPKQEARNSENGTFNATPRPQKQAAVRNCYKVAENSGGKSFTFSQSDGPPPDPVYNFLADVERDPKFGNVGGNIFRGSRGGRATSAYYREREANVEAKNRNRRRGYGRGYGNDISVKPEYEAWKNERSEIDRQRINRQKTAGGEWRREWDKEKTESMDDSLPETVERKNFHLYERNTLKNYIQNFDSESSSSSKKFPANFSERGNIRVSRANVRGQRVVSYSVIPTSPANTGSAATPKSPKSERTVTDFGDSIKVSLPNNTSPTQKAKVSTRNTAGSGRVPHQKYRTSYSSQSEDDSTQKPDVRRSGKRSFQTFRGEDSNRGNQIPSKDAKATTTTTNTVDGDQVVKPPLPPNTERRDPLRPRKQRGRYVKNDNRNRQREKVQNISNDATKEADSSSKDDAVSGDDGWEDIATSGTESMSEDVLPKEHKAELGTVDSNIGSETNNPSDIGKCEAASAEVTCVKEVVNNECEPNVPKALTSSGTNDQLANNDKHDGGAEKANDNAEPASKEDVGEQMRSPGEEICLETKDVPVDVGKCESNSVKGNLEIVSSETAVNKEENKSNHQEAVICHQTTDQQGDTDKIGNDKDCVAENVEPVNTETPVSTLKQSTETRSGMDRKQPGNNECESSRNDVSEEVGTANVEKSVDNDANVSDKDIRNDNKEVINKESNDEMKSSEIDLVGTNQVACETESDKQNVSKAEESPSNDGKLSVDNEPTKLDITADESKQ